MDANEDSLPLFSSGKLANHLGMSSQGLFWYEKEHLIEPSKENKRRSYSTDDLYLLSRIRFYRQAGFSLEQANEMLDLDIDEAAMRLENQAATMREALRKEEARISIVEQRAELAKSFKEQEGTFARVHVEPFFFKESFVRRIGSSEIEKYPLDKYWVQDIPFSQYASISKNSPAPHGIESTTGLALPERYLKFASAETRAEIETGAIQRFDPGEALYGLIASGAASDYDIASKAAPGISESLDGKNLMKRPILSHRQDAGALAYWEVWFF